MILNFITAMARKDAILSTAKKWENEFKCNLGYDIAHQKVFRLRCVDCKTWESMKMNSMKNFNKTWSSPSYQLRFT